MENDNDFWQYIKGVFDTNKDGKVSAKELFISGASTAPLLIAIFVELLVAFAEVRVWDLGMQITGGNWGKAILFVLISAFPFYLGQIAWLYPRANFWQKGIGLATIAGGLITSFVFGRVDLLVGINVVQMTEADVVGMSTALVPVYIVGGLIYLWQDDGIQQIRARIIAKHKAQAEADKLQSMRVVLSEYRKTHALRREIEKEFGREVVNEFEGGKQKPTKQPQTGLGQAVVMAKDTEAVQLKDTDPNADRGGK